MTRTACNGTYTRHPDGWRYPWGELVPGGEDMTITNLYNPLVLGKLVVVPGTLARNEPELAFCLDHPRFLEVMGQERAERMRARTPEDIDADALAVPLDVWDEHAREPIGMWAPELHATLLLGIQDVARLAGVKVETIRQHLKRDTIPTPQGVHVDSPWWTRPVIDHWLATRRPQGRRKTGG